LTWEGFGREDSPALRVTSEFAARANEPWCRCRIRVDGAGATPQEVVFPRVEKIARQEDEVLAVPMWMGEMTRQARAMLSRNGGSRMEWLYPGLLSMQCLAVYRDNGSGLCVAANDAKALGKRFAVIGGPEESLGVEVAHLPESGGEPNGNYETPYETMLGVFHGNWYDAAALYRETALLQPWAKDSRLQKETSPAWVNRTALWVWNRGRSKDVLEPASIAQETLGLPVSVFWHWWHGCAYDMGFPEYLPPREGAESFKSAVTLAHQNGLRAIVYMNQRLWGMTTKSWTDEGAERFAVKGRDGKVAPEVYNTFTKAPCASMCMGTEFWRGKYARIATEAFNGLGVDGFYMDQACSSLTCYDPGHGHPLGGGSYWMNGFKLLAEDLRNRCKGAALAGEGCGEAWLPHLDMMLSLQVSMERYSGPNGWEPIPFFHAVYHGYGVFFGNYSSLTMPPYDDLWPSEFAPKEPLKLLDRKFSTQFRLEQARAFAWGQQPTIANFTPNQLTERAEELDFVFRLARIRDKAREYLLNGEMLPPPSVESERIEFDMSRLSIYAGQQDALKEFRQTAPSVLASAWKSESGKVAVVLASISDKQRDCSLSLDRGEYPIPDSGTIYQITENGKQSYSGFNKDWNGMTIKLEPFGASIFVFE
jgi:hypothetical protein